MTINRSNMAKQLVPGLHEVLGLAYNENVGEHKALFDIVNSDRAFEEEVQMSGLGPASVKSEGAAVQYDDMQELWTARYSHETIALAFAITEEAMEDNLYEDYASRSAQFLGRSLADTKETKAANVFNNGFNASYSGGDGQPLFSDSHPTVIGSFDNKVAVDLSETALQDACIAISKFTDERGILINAMPNSLHIPTELKFVAEKIMKSDLSTTTATVSGGITNVNDVNALRSMGTFPKGVFVNHRFTDGNAWFIRTNVPHGTKMFVRSPLATKMEGDFETGNMRFKARERYVFGWSDPRQWYGSTGTS